MASKIRVEDFETAALPHLNDLYRTALRVISNASEAEDLVQETYLQGWKSFERFEPGTNCRAWLFKILFHVIHHHRRKNFRISYLGEDETILENTLVYEAPIPQHLSDEEVLLALQKIPQHYREVVLLADVEEFSYKEVAETLNIPVGTVMSRLNRGRSQLRVHLAGVAHEYGIQPQADVVPIQKAK